MRQKKRLRDVVCRSGLLVLAATLGQPVSAEGVLRLLATIPVDPAGPAGAVDGLAFSADGRLLAASDNAATARVYDLQDPARPFQRPTAFRHGSVGPKPGHASAAEMNAVVFSPDGRWLAGGIDQGGLLVWEVATGRESQHLDDGTNTDGAAFSPDGCWLASAAGNRLVIRPFDPQNGTAGPAVLDERVAAEGEVNSVSWAQDSRLLAAAGLKVVALYRFAGGAFHPVRRIPNEGRSGSVKSVRISPDGALVAIGARDERARVFALDSGELVVDLPQEGNRRYLPGDDDDKNVAVEAVAWSEDGALLFTSGLIDGVMRVWRRDDWSLVDWRQAQAPLRGIEFIDVRGGLVAVGGDEGVVNLYRLRHPPLKPRFLPDEASQSIVVEAEDFDTNVEQSGGSWGLSNGAGASGAALVTRGTPPTSERRPSYDPTRDPPKLDYRLGGLPDGPLRLWARVRGRCDLKVALAACAADVRELATITAEEHDNWTWRAIDVPGVAGRAATLQLWPGPGEWIEVDRFVVAPAGSELDLTVNNGLGPSATPRRRSTNSSKRIDE
ncbi:MAG: WD40 repeat domain-containing protein [Lacipirellulaceae bacterium]